MAFWKKNAGFLQKKTVIDPARLPKHIAIIMDGNGRWAARRGLPRSAGHAAGSETFRRIATECKEMGIAYLTVYAFSTENWKRSDEEVGGILGLLETYLHEAIDSMERDGIRLRFLGDLEALPPTLRPLVAKTDRLSESIDGIQVNVCFNYGSRREMVQAARRLVEMACAGQITPDDVTEEALAEGLYLPELPDPDLIIRPSGEYRLSNFLLWQSAYAELYFTETLWPDFSRVELYKAVAAYQKRNRRFGGR